MQGTSLNSRYRIIEYIAKGGFGKTYLAEDTQLPGKNKCVVKQLHLSVDDPNFIKVARRLFKTEAQTLHHLGTHDRIPRLLAYFEEDEKFYLVQQYIEGHTLSHELEEGQTWTEDRVIELLQDCLDILGFIHSKKVIHRDVKPDNLIRRNADNKLVLVDFGTVKEIIAEQTQLIPATVVVGTRGYMPTEQARGKPRATSDIYALGVIAIQALTGIHPINLPENDNGEIVWQDQATCSQQLQEIVTKMTCYHFKERYQNAGEVTAALDGISNRIDNQDLPTKAVAYSPTVQLSGTQVANLGGQPVASPSPTVARDAFVATPQNLTISPVPPSSLVVEPQQSENIEQPPIAADNSMRNQKSSKTLITLGSALAVGAIAAGGMYFLNQQSAKTTQANLQEQIAYFEEKIADRDYQSCYEEAIAMKNVDEGNQTSLMSTEQQQEFEAQCGLALAQTAATDLKHGEALAIAKTLPRNTSLNTDIQQQTNLWSEKLLQQATQIYERQGNLEAAIGIVKQIPQDSAIRPQAIDAKEVWKTEAKQNESIIFTAKKALSEEKWQYAKQEAVKVKDSSPSMYWQEQAKAIINQAEEGIAATAPQPESAKVVTPVQPVTPKTNVASPKPLAPIAPAKTIEPMQPQTVTQPTTPPTPPEELRDLSSDGDALPGLPSTPPTNETLRDL